MEYNLDISDKKDKKFMVETPKGKTLHFGSSSHEDFTIHKDIERRENYLARHKKNENWHDLETAGAWSRWLLWSEPSLSESIKLMQDKFNIKIIVTCLW